MADRNDFLTKMGSMIGLGALGAAGTYVVGRFLFKSIIANTTAKIFTEPYNRNIIESFIHSRRDDPVVILDTILRAETGKALMRPMGSPFPINAFQGMRFNTAMIDRWPTPNDVEIDTTLVLGKQAAKPLRLEIPILIGGMGWGLGLSKPAKLALAEAATMTGTATNSGDGPFNDWERAAARHYIVQYGRARLNRDPDLLRQADMIEIQFGHCGWAGIGRKYGWDELTPELRQAYGLKPREDMVYHARFPELSSPRDLRGLVSDLKKITGGVPIGVKISCSKYLERDLAHILDAEADVIDLDGGQAASHSAPATLMDNFGLSTISALCRASRWLDKENASHRVSLIVGGGLETPGDFLKALALGADGVSIGAVALMALVHNQEFKALPFESPIQLLWYGGRYKNRFNSKQGARYLANFLRACVEEMRLAARALGKTTLRDISADDLVATDELTAKIADIPLEYQSLP